MIHAETPLRITVRGVGDVVSEILSKMRIIISVCESDLQKQTYNNEFRTNEEQKEPYSTQEKIKCMRQEVEKTMDSYYALMKSLDKLCEYNADIENVRVRRNIRKCHCKHCRGEDGSCACKVGCVRSVRNKCRPRHCEHCSGNGMCKCVHNCEKAEGIQCQTRTTFKSSKKTPKMKAEKEVEVLNAEDEDVIEDDIEEASEEESLPTLEKDKKRNIKK